MEWWEWEVRYTAGTPAFSWNALLPRLFQLRHFICDSIAVQGTEHDVKYDKTYKEIEILLRNKAVWRETQYLACTYGRDAALAYVKIMVIPEPVIRDSSSCTCPKCSSEGKKGGKRKSGAQRWRCSSCGYYWTNEEDKVNQGNKRWERSDLKPKRRLT